MNNSNMQPKPYCTRCCRAPTRHERQPGLLFIAYQKQVSADNIAQPVKSDRSSKGVAAANCWFDALRWPRSTPITACNSSVWLLMATINTLCSTSI